MAERGRLRGRNRVALLEREAGRVVQLTAMRPRLSPHGWRTFPMPGRNLTCFPTTPWVSRGAVEAGHCKHMDVTTRLPAGANYP